MKKHRNRVLVTVTFLAIQAITFQAFSASFKNSKEAAIRLKCSLAVTGYENARSRGVVGDEFICFRNEKIIADKIEKSVCAIRQVYTPTGELTGLSSLPDSDSNEETLFSEYSCEDGGVKQILAMPVSETSSVLATLVDSSALTGFLTLLTGDRLSKEFDVIAKALKTHQSTASPRFTNRTHGKKGKKGKSGAPAGRTRGAPDYPPEKGEPSAALSPPNPQKAIDVFYATDRKFVPDQAPDMSFSGQPNLSEQLAMGVAHVTIPTNHKEGVVESPSIWKLEFSQDPEKHITLDKIKNLDTNSFYSLMKSKVDGSPRKDAFVFIHGYNTSFADAARKTAQIAVDMKFKGAPIFFSWPAGDSIWQYGKAEANVDWSFVHLAYLLQDIVTKSGSKNIYLIAHSMGNRVLTYALNYMTDKNMFRSSQAFKHIILAAPDVDVRIFKRMAPSVHATTQFLTLYASDNDKAIKASKFFHDFQRVGQAGSGILQLDFMDSIDASSTDTSLLGHSYFGSAVTVLDDIAEIVEKDQPAMKRPHLIEVIPNDTHYFRFHL